jgi:hypothetical protein
VFVAIWRGRDFPRQAFLGFEIDREGRGAQVPISTDFPMILPPSILDSESWVSLAFREF